VQSNRDWMLIEMAFCDLISLLVTSETVNIRHSFSDTDDESHQFLLLHYSKLDGNLWTCIMRGNNTFGSLVVSFERLKQ
jgi:hypothetical protein